MSETVLATALAFARHGLAVFPVWWPVTHNGQTVCACGRLCGTPAKHPVARYARNGVYSATTDIHLIRELWELRCPQANLGLHCAGLIVVDIDPRHGGDESLKQLEAQHGEMPRSWVSYTGGGGQHLFFSCPDGVKVSNVVAELIKPPLEPPLGHGIDVRTRGGFVVAPPSRHVSGGLYVWSVDNHPSETPLAPAPAWVIERLTRARGGTTDPDSIPEPLPSDVWWRLTHQPIEEYRDQAAVRIAGHLFAHWCDYQLVLGLMHSWNSAWCKPPLGYLELKQIVDRIARKQANKRSWQ